MATQLLRKAASVLLGLASGLGIALGWAALSAPPPADERFAALERQLARLEGALDGSHELAKPDERRSPSEAVAIEALWSAKLAEHAAEASDERWATEASRKLEVDLTRLGDGQRFSLVRTECRTTSCSATLRWPSYQAAVDEFTALLHAGYEVECPRRITLPEPEDRQRPYEGTILFDCTRERGSGAVSP